MNLTSLAITLVSSSNWLASLVVSLAKYAMCAMLKLQLQCEFAFNSPAVDYKYAAVSNSGVQLQAMSPNPKNFNWKPLFQTNCVSVS